MSSRREDAARYARASLSQRQRRPRRNPRSPNTPEYQRPKLSFAVDCSKRYMGDLYTETGQTSECSFSSVSTPPIARVGACFSTFRELQDFHAFAPLRTQNFSKKIPYYFL